MDVHDSVVSHTLLAYSYPNYWVIGVFGILLIKVSELI